MRLERARARGAAASGANTCAPSTASICAALTAAGRSSTGPAPWSSRDRSRMVDSMPTSDAPPSSTGMPAATSSGNSARTCSASVGETCPNLLADGAATPPCPFDLPAAKAASKAWATGCEGQRRPMLSCPPLTVSAMCGARLRISVSGPGQNASISSRAARPAPARPSTTRPRPARYGRSQDGWTAAPWRRRSWPRPAGSPRPPPARRRFQSEKPPARRPAAGRRRGRFPRRG